MKVPNNTEGIIHNSWIKNNIPICIRIKKYDQWRYNIIPLACIENQLYLFNIPNDYYGCECQVISFYISDDLLTDII